MAAIGRLLPEGSSPRTPGLYRKQLSANLVEIGQCEHGLRSGQVLGQAAISDLGEAPELLNDAKGVLATGSGPRARAVDHSPTLAQRLLCSRPPIDPVAQPPRLEKLSVVFLPVRLVAEDFPLVSVQQLRQLRNVSYAGSGRSHRMHDAAPIRADVQLHPKVPVTALAGLLHLRIADRTRVLGRAGRR